VRSQKGSYLQGGADRTGDLILTNTVFHATGDPDGTRTHNPQPGTVADRPLNILNTDVPTNEVFHAMHVILSLKLGDHEGLALFIHGCLLKKTLLVVLPVILIQIPIHTFLSPVPACCRGQSGTSWCCLAAAGGMPAPRHPNPGNSVSVLYILHYFSDYSYY